MSLQEEIETLKAIKLADAKQFSKDFYGASDATISIIGDFDDAKAKKILTEGLGSWKSPKPYKRIEKKSFDVKTTNAAIKTPDKANAFFSAALNIPMKDDDIDYASTWVGNYILGGSGLSSRLANRIRQKEGLSYGVGSGFTADPLDKVASFAGGAIYAPENVEKLEKAFKEEIEKFVKEGITQAELDDAKKSIAQSRMVGRSNDKQLMRTLSSYLFLNRTLQFDAKFEEQIAKLTLADVNNAIKKYLDPAKISIFKAGDFDKVKKP